MITHHVTSRLSSVNSLSLSGKMLLKYFLALLCLTCVQSNGQKREMITSFNPGCQTQKCQECSPGVVYVVSKGDNDILHYVISAIGGPPTALVIRTNKPKGRYQLNIDCKKMVSKNDTERADAITMPIGVKELYSFGVVFSRLFQYNDTADKADITSYNINSTNWRVYDFTEFKWEDMTTWSSNDLIVMKVKDSGKVKGAAFYNGSLEIQFHLFDQSDRSKELPHLQYNADSTQFDFTLQNIDTGNYSTARWGLEAILLGDDKDTVQMSIETKKSIDDEYTPGVFQISNWYTRPGDRGNGGYLQWKPVCYLKSTRARSVATKVDTTKLHSTADVNVEGFLQSSIMYTYYPNIQLISRYATNFTFGLTKDGGFTTTNYTSWTAQLGYGAPPEDKISSLVVGVISAGLGIPVILILFGGLFVIIKKKTSKGEYTEVGQDNSSIQ